MPTLQSVTCIRQGLENPYEKFGFKTMGGLAIDLQKFGDYEPYITWDMQREAV